MTQGTQVHRVWVPSASIPFLRVLGSMWIRTSPSQPMGTASASSLSAEYGTSSSSLSPSTERAEGRGA